MILASLLCCLAKASLPVHAACCALAQRLFNGGFAAFVEFLFDVDLYPVLSLRCRLCDALKVLYLLPEPVRSCCMGEEFGCA